MQLISLNIEHDHHLDKVLPFLKSKNPDVILLQEIFKEDIPVFEETLNMQSVFTGLNYLTGSTRKLPTLCIATFSRFPIISHRVVYYRGEEADLPTISTSKEAHKMARALLITEVEKEGKRYTLINTHFTWSADATPSAMQFEDLEKVLSTLSTIPQFVFCADLNSPRGKVIFDTFSRKYQDNIPASVTTTIDKNLHKAKGLNIVVDCIFTQGYEARNVEVIDGVSDHCAISAYIAISSKLR